MSYRSIFFLITIILFISCQTATTEHLSKQESYWRSIGYGKILSINENTYSFYDMTNISCLPAQQGDITVLNNYIAIHNDTLILSKGTGTYYYQKIDQLPELCTLPLSKEKKKDPQYNFEVMTQTIKEHYAYFELNKINWDSLYLVSKDKIRKDTSEAELYLVLEEIISTLKDNHGYIEPTEEVYEQAEKIRIQKPEKEEIEDLYEYGDFEVAKIAAETFIYEDLTKDTWLLHWGTTENNVGYIQIKSMWLHADLELPKEKVKENGYVNTYVETMAQMNEGEYIKKEREGISKIMDQVITDLRDTKYMIIDIRFNGGGQDEVSLEILKRFTTEKRTVAYKKAVLGKGYTDILPITLNGYSKPYQKPVYLLTSQQSASAADFFTLASMSLPNIKRVGSHTQGALSDAMENKLPNEWYFSISNEVYTDPFGKCYENIGIPVDYELNYPEDRQTFFRSIAENPDIDKQNILNAIQALQNVNR